MAEHELPIFGLADELQREPFKPAGDTARQIALNDLAWQMVEQGIDGQNRPSTRISHAWLAARGWSVALLGIHTSDEAEDRLASAVRRQGHDSLIFVVVSDGMPRPSAAIRLPADSAALHRAIAFNPCNELAVFPEDRSLLIFVVNDGYIAVAGTPAFLRDAIDRDFARISIEEVTDMSRKSPFGDWLAPELAHYAPFLLDGA